MRYEPTWESLSNFKVPAWFQNAKFGIFIHWGVYAVPAFDSEWYPRNMYLQGTRAFEHHQTTWGHQSKFGYKDFIPMFRAERFDAARWADLFKRAGAKYVVPVSEHHDGFAMYDCSYSRWTSVKMGPCRDIIGEIAAAVRNQGLIFGLSNHRAEHWWFMNGGKAFDSDMQNPDYADLYGPAMPAPTWTDPDYGNRDWQPRPDATFLEDWFARNLELVDKYQPELIYFDWCIRQLAFEPYIQRFAAHYYNRGLEWGKQVAINSKEDGFPPSTSIFDIERGKLKDIRPVAWQADTSISNNSWCYIEDQDYKSATQIIHDLIDIVSKNGNLLLNIGPRSDGTIVETEESILLEIGRWLSVNGEAIYGSRPWKIYGEGSTEVVEGAFQEGKRVPFTAQDIRFTIKGKTLYAIALGCPANHEITIQSLGMKHDYYPSAITRVQLLGIDKPLEWSRTSSSLTVKLPAIVTNEPALVLKIET